MQSLVLLALAFAADGFAPNRIKSSTPALKSAIQDIEISKTSEPAVELSSQLLVLDRHVDPRGVLLEAAKPTTTVVCYDSKEDTCLELAELIAKARELNSVDGKFVPFETVALATHGGALWELTEDLVVPMTGDELPPVLEAVNPMMSMLAVCTEKDTGRVDLLGCSLLSCQPRLVEGLEEMHGVNFCASDDYTGNLIGGGDWVMESDGIDISGTYWDKVALADYEGIMWFGTFMKVGDYIPLFGTVARTVEAGVYAATGDTDAAYEAIKTAGENLAGDALGLVTGGAGKVGVAVFKPAVRGSVKVIATQGTRAAIKAGGRASMKLVKKNLSPSRIKQLTKQYIKKEYTGKELAKKQLEGLLNGTEEVSREELEDLLAEESGTPKLELEGVSEDTLNEIASAVLLKMNEKAFDMARAAL